MDHYRGEKRDTKEIKLYWDIKKGEKFYDEFVFAI